MKECFCGKHCVKKDPFWECEDGHLLSRKLESVYGKSPIKRDIWGKRPAMPKEIKAVIKNE
jgi:hypothetical protein